MNFNKLARRLRREAVANPKKAAVLGVLAVVAIYFWAPLVTGWFGNDPAKPAAPAVASSQPVSSPVEAASPSPPAGPTAPQSETDLKPPHSKRAQYPWQMLAKWIEKDLRSRPADPFAGDRDPFETPQVRKVEKTVAVKPAPPKPVEPELTPRQLSLTLTGTIIGPSRRVARINGKSYEQGKTLEVSTKDGKKFAFQLSEVGTRQVVLQRNGKRYEMQIESPKRSGRIEVLGVGQVQTAN